MAELYRSGEVREYAYLDTGERRAVTEFHVPA
jgi:hypothetical protein